MRKKRLWLKIVGVLTLLFFALTLFALAKAAKIAKELPDPGQFVANRQISQSSKIYDRSGEILLYEIYDEEKRTIIPFEEIPEQVKQAAISLEDKNFYTHPAFDWRAILRAMIVNFLKGRVVQGGSTITQQLAKNAFLASEKTFERKFKELILSYWIEKKYSKDEILSLYLNTISYGANTYGIEAASQMYFGKPAKNLNLAEAALLSGLPKAPTYYSPYGSHLNDLISRKDYALGQMKEMGFIDEEEFGRAQKYEFNFIPQNLGSIKAPHFVMMTKEYLVNKYGEDFLKKGGLKIITTLDWSMQQEAEAVIKEGAERNEKLYNGKNAALVAQDPKTGQILALVGSQNYFDVKNEGNFNVAASGLRQPGSSFKPFAYLTAFKKGYLPETVVFDAPTEFVPNNPNCPTIVDYSTPSLADCYHPENYDKKFRGPINLRNALSQSINVPAVKILYLAGVEDTVKTAQDLGITTLGDPWRYGLSLVLGGGEVKLTDMVNAYSVFAQEGVKREQKLILKIEDAYSNEIESFSDTATQVIEPQYARILNDVLSDEEARRPFLSNSFELTTFPDKQVALKTGTSDDKRDAWTIGYTPSLVVGVWAGNNRQEPMQAGSVLAALPIWSAFMTRILPNYSTEVFNKPAVDQKIEKAMINGEYLLPDGQVHDILYFVDKNDPLGLSPLNPGDDPQFKNWESATQEWLTLNRH
ncbi:MAG: PBP1A family penicillin-binding protein [Patescibacteria group bacterium]